MIHGRFLARSLSLPIALSFIVIGKKSNLSHDDDFRQPDIRQGHNWNFVKSVNDVPCELRAPEDFLVRRYNLLDMSAMLVAYYGPDSWFYKPVVDNTRGTRVEQVVSPFQKILRGSQLTWYIFRKSVFFAGVKFNTVQTSTYHIHPQHLVIETRPREMYFLIIISMPIPFKVVSRKKK